MKKAFQKTELKKLYRPPENSSGEDNGQLTIIGGSSLFHGAPLLSLRVASRVADMVFFSSPEKTMEQVVAYIKSDLSSFIWTPWHEVDQYIEKSDAILIGPGFMRFHSEKVSLETRTEVCDEACQLTKSTTETLLSKYPHKKWVIDAGSLQTIEAKFLPPRSIVTPNKHEYRLLFGEMEPAHAAQKYECIIVVKGPTTFVYSQNETIAIEGGNAGLTKGGTGDVQAGLTAALLTKNEPFLAACAASYIVKATADSMYEKVGTIFNSDDLADTIPSVLHTLLNTN